MVEYNPHQAGNSRADVLLLGTSSGKSTVVVIELKQWSKATWNAETELVVDFGARYSDVEHPYRQASRYAQFLQNYSAGFDPEHATVHAAAFLHNADAASIASLRNTGRQIEADRVFTGDASGREDFVGWLREVFDQNPSQPPIEIASALDRAAFQQSDGLLADLVEMVSNPARFPLTDQQQAIVQEISKKIHEVLSPHADKQQAVFVVKGGPGTGKTWIAMHLLAAASRDKLQALYSTASTALREAMKDALKRDTESAPLEGLITSARSETFWNTENWGSQDVVIVDEAQRLTEYTIRTGFGNAKHIQDELEAHRITQLLELKKTGKILVLFIDEGQATTAKDYVTIDHARQIAERVGADYRFFHLTEQHRSGGSLAYEQWVRALVEGDPVEWHDEDSFTVEVADSVEDLEARTMAKARPGCDDSRLVAGFAWEWRSKVPTGGPASDLNDLPYDFEIGTWRKRWNLSKTVTAPHPTDPSKKVRYPKSDLWAVRPNGVEQIGSIFSGQAFEFKNVGVLFGLDMVARNGRMTVQPDESKNTALLRKMKKDPSAEERIANQYRVLLTRAMESVVLFSIDPETQAMFKSLVNPKK